MYSPRTLSLIYEDSLYSTKSGANPQNLSTFIYNMKCGDILE